MRKHRGGTSRRDPRFDSLEERSLLSGGFPAPNFHPGEFDLPQFPTDHVELVVQVERGFDFTLSSHWGPPIQFDPLSPAVPGNPQLPNPDGSGQSLLQANVPSPAIPIILLPSNSQVPSRSNSGPPFSPPGNSASTFDSSAAGAAKNQSGTMGSGRDSAERISVPAQLDGILASGDGVALGTSRDSTQEASGIGNDQTESAASSLPAQVVELLGAHSSTNVWLDASFKAPAGFDRSSAADVVAPEREGIDQHGNPSIGRRVPALAADGSELAKGELDLPNPHTADLIARVLPWDRGTLDRAIDQFFKQVDELDDGSSVGGQQPARIAFLSAALASSFAGMDIIRRRWRRWKAGNDVRRRDPVGGGEHIGFPELPGSWSSRLT